MKPLYTSIFEGGYFYFIFFICPIMRMNHSSEIKQYNMHPTQKQQKAFSKQQHSTFMCSSHTSLTENTKYLFVKY